MLSQRKYGGNRAFFQIAPMSYYSIWCLGQYPQLAKEGTQEQCKIKTQNSFITLEIHTTLKDDNYFCLMSEIFWTSGDRLDEDNISERALVFCVINLFFVHFIVQNSYSRLWILPNIYADFCVTSQIEIWTSFKFILLWKTQILTPKFRTCSRNFGRMATLVYITCNHFQASPLAK